MCPLPGELPGNQPAKEEGATVPKLILLLVCLWMVDRVEGDWAVLVSPDGVVKDMLLTDLPEGTDEGDCLEWGEE